ncbi:MAG TPA: hypothetical protein VF902_02335 [Coriobacteriia bacterium]
MRFAGMRLRTASALALMLALAVPMMAPGAAWASKTIGLSRGTFNFAVAPGGEGSGQFDVLNMGTESFKAMVYTASASADASGNPTYSVPGREDTDGRNPAGWIRVKTPESTKFIGNVPYLEMKPGEKLPISFTFGVPDGAAPGDRTVVVFFEMYTLPGEANPSGAAVSGRIGSSLKIRVTGEIAENVFIDSFTVPSFVLGSEVPYSYTVHNDSNIDKNATATVSLVDSTDQAVSISRNLTDTILLTKTRRPVAGTLPAGFGPHKVKLLVEYMHEFAGGSEARQIEESRDVWVVPVWVLVALVVVLLSGLLAPVVRRWARNRRARQRELTVARLQVAEPLRDSDGTQ